MKKPRILLINPLCRLPCLIPLGLGYIASVLRDAGYNVRLLDINGFGYDNEKVERIIRQTDFDIAGIGGLTSTYKYVKWLSKVIKKHKPRVHIVAGNMVSTAHPRQLLENSDVDVAVIDEGEITFKELVQTVGEGGDLKNVKGIVYKNGTGITETAPRERITDLDSLPFPAWDLFPMEIYLNNPAALSRASFGRRRINVSTTRGCPYNCIFCSHPFGRKVYKRFAAGIVDEIRELNKRYGVEFINFCDDLFLINEARVLEFCERMIAEKLNIGWSASGRVNLVNAELLKKMRRAGCASLSYGFESGSQMMLDRMRKNAAVKQAEDAVRMTQSSGIKVAGSFIFGMPGETEGTIRETLGFIRRARLPLYRFFYATPYPSTELYRIAREMGRLPEDEDKYLESLSEMRTTFLVNLTGFSDEELVRRKNLAEAAAKRNLSLQAKMELCVEDWQRRLTVISQSVKKRGLRATSKKIIARVLDKMKWKR